MTTTEPRVPLGSPRDVAEYLGVPENTLRHWRQVGGGPRYISVRRHIRYRWVDVDKWLARQPQGGETCQPVA